MLDRNHIYLKDGTRKRTL